MTDFTGVGFTAHVNVNLSLFGDFSLMTLSSGGSIEVAYPSRPNGIPIVAVNDRRRSVYDAAIERVKTWHYSDISSFHRQEAERRLVEAFQSPAEVTIFEEEDPFRSILLLEPSLEPSSDATMLLSVVDVPSDSTLDPKNNPIYSWEKITSGEGSRIFLVVTDAQRTFSWGYPVLDELYVVRLSDEQVESTIRKKTLLKKN